MARFWKIDGKVARAAIAYSEYQDFLLIAKGVSYRKAIYVFDSNTHQLIKKLDSVTKAMKYKVNFFLGRLRQQQRRRRRTQLLKKN